MEEMDRYRSCTSVTLGNGATTSFWFDSWLHETPLSTLFSALFSHVLGPDTTVQFVFQHDFDLHLRPRLTTTTGRHSFAMCQKHTAKAVKLTANDLPCVTHGKRHTAYIGRQSGYLPCIGSRAHGKGHIGTRQTFFGKK